MYIYNIYICVCKILYFYFLISFIYLISLLSYKFLISLLLLYYFCSEIVGFVDGVEASKNVGDNRQYKIFKFYISNGQGRRVQVIVWNDDIEHVEAHVKLNHVSILFFSYYLK